MQEKLKWLKEHKKEVLIGAGVLAGTTLLIVIGVKSHKAAKLRKVENAKLIETFEEAGNALVPNCQIDLEKIPVKDLGKTGQRFLDAFPGITEETLVNVVAYIEKKDLV